MRLSLNRRFGARTILSARGWPVRQADKIVRAADSWRRCAIRELLKLPLNLKLERRHAAGLNRAQGKNAWVSPVAHVMAMPVAVSRLQVGALTGARPVSRSNRNRELSINQSLFEQTCKGQRIYHDP